jgi:BirA family biotin operon repressor/biotin-[acetyl-CoA-carboxylase] ligase
MVSMNEASEYSLYRLLRSRLGDYVDLSEIEAATGVGNSRAFDLIALLTRLGAPIETHPILGYRLTDVPGPMLAAEIFFELETSWCGRDLQVEDTVSSTNDTARQRALDGAPEGAVVVAETQTAGRGRRGRLWWQSPRGEGLLFSLILRPPPSYLETGFLTILLGSAIARSIRLQCGVPLFMKWPNDLVVKEKNHGLRKLGGILCERTPESSLIAGVGLNVNQASFPPELRSSATSIRIETRSEANRCLLLKRILAEIERDYQCAGSGGEGLILDQARSLSATLGHHIEIETEVGLLRGLALDLDSDGALLLQEVDSDSTQARSDPIRVTAGDVVSARPRSPELDG